MSIASLIPKIRLGAKTVHVTLTTPIMEYFVIPRLTLDIFYQHTKFGDSCFCRFRDIIAGVEIENKSRDPVHTPFRGGLSSKARTWYSLPVYKIWRLASAVPEISLGARSLNWVKWPWPLLFKGGFVLHMLGLDIAYLYIKFDHCSYSRFRDKLGATKI